MSVYNGDNYLAAAIESILAQGYGLYADRRGRHAPALFARVRRHDRSLGRVLAGDARKNGGLMASDPTVRFEAVMLNMFMCVDIFGLTRRSMIMRTSLYGPFGGADKVMLAEMSLLGRFWLGQETLFFRRCHAKQFSAAASGRLSRRVVLRAAGFDVCPAD